MIPLGPVVARGRVRAVRTVAWSYLVDPAKRERWWPELQLENGFGGSVAEQWTESVEGSTVSRDASGQIDVWVDGHAVGFTWKDAGDEKSTAVLITLRSQGGMTGITVTETGFDALPSAAERAAASQEGWQVLLRDLLAAVAAGDEAGAAEAGGEAESAEDGGGAALSGSAIVDAESAAVADDAERADEAADAHGPVDGADSHGSHEPETGEAGDDESDIAGTAGAEIEAEGDAETESDLGSEEESEDHDGGAGTGVDETDGGGTETAPGDGAEILSEALGELEVVPDELEGELETVRIETIEIEVEAEPELGDFPELVTGPIPVQADSETVPEESGADSERFAEEGFDEGSSDAEDVDAETPKSADEGTPGVAKPDEDDRDENEVGFDELMKEFRGD